jgi:hypothetical protein
MSILHVYVPCPYCLSMDMQHRHEGAAPWTAALTWTCRMDINLQHVQEHAAWTWICNIDIDMQHGWIETSSMYTFVHGACSCPCCMSMSNPVYQCTWCLSMSVLLVQVHASRMWTCSRDMDIQQRHKHASWTWTSSIYRERSRTWTCNMNIIIDKQHILVHAACLCPYCMSISMLHARVHAIVPIQVHPANPCPCWMYMSVLQGIEHAALTWTCSMDIYT